MLREGIYTSVALSFTSSLFASQEALLHHSRWRIREPQSFLYKWRNNEFNANCREEKADEVFESDVIINYLY